MYKCHIASVAAILVSPTAHDSVELAGALSAQNKTESAVSMKPVLRSSGLICPESLSSNNVLMTLVTRSVLVLLVILLPVYIDKSTVLYTI